ncbi:MAG: DUF1697 domain-containing protein [Alphaproteobacteria bacterium]
MASVVFLRAVNVGTANRCQPAVLAKQLSKFGVINIGAVGTFVARENVSESILHRAFAEKLPFKCEIMICPARDIIRLVSKDPFAECASEPEVTRFVNVLAKPRRHFCAGSRRTSTIKPQTSELAKLPLCLPSNDDWLLKVIAVENRFVLGLYRRRMKAISYLGKIEKLFGVPATNRNWNTIQKIMQVLLQD